MIITDTLFNEWGNIDGMSVKRGNREAARQQDLIDRAGGIIEYMRGVKPRPRPDPAPSKTPHTTRGGN